MASCFSLNYPNGSIADHQPSLFFLDLCVDAGCEDICVSEPNKIKPTCLCRLGYSLNDDGRTCTGNDQKP